ncbi:MAG: 2-polyprenylphenol 6-hydroxylase [Alphaproteobacteria bacterium]|nr:2-polyprenylphenol 6-hydroxylase [Alphaproteobacteria bacterium]
MPFPRWFQFVWITLILLPAWRRRRLARALERLGPSFIKLGQTLSTRADLLGEALALDLAQLRDRLPPFPARIARRIVTEELGQDMEQLFAAFDDVPVAAASIAQVHKARLPDGRAVAVKILRPGIEKAFARDFRFFLWAGRVLERRFPSTRRLKPLEVVGVLVNTVRFELDLRYEAAAMAEIAENMRNDGEFRVPRVEWRMASQKVLVSEWVDGIPIHETEALIAAGFDPNALLARLSEVFFLQAFRDGFFHADLHPGNLFVDAKGHIVAVDFGITGRLDWKTRLYMAEIFRGFLTEDYRAVAEAHFKAGYVPRHQSVAQFTQACMAIAKPILGRPAQEVSVAKLLAQLLQVTETFEMETQPQLLLFQKTLVVVEGIGRMLNPNVNMWEMARPPIEAWAAEHLGPLGKTRRAWREANEMFRLLPEALREAAWRMEERMMRTPEERSSE